MSRIVVRSGSPYEDRYSFSRALRVGDRILVAGTAPIEDDGSCGEGAGAQTRRCLQIIDHALREVGASLQHVVRTRMFITDAADADEIGAVHGEMLREARPTATMVVVAGLLDPRWKVEIEAEALL